MTDNAKPNNARLHEQECLINQYLHDAESQQLASQMYTIQRNAAKILAQK